MNRNYILILVLILVSSCVIGYFVINEFSEDLNTSDNIKVGKAQFTLSDNYVNGGMSKSKDLTIKNGTDEIFLSTVNGSVKNHVNSYLENLENRSIDGKISTFTIDDITVYKVNAMNTTTVHYWFEKDKNVFEIYSWDGTNIDGTVRDMIKSMKIN